MTCLEPLKPVVGVLISYYRDELMNSSGGNLHIVLDDGNIGDNDIWYCQEECEKRGDDMGYLIATVLRNFTETEREKMYNNNWNGLLSGGSK